MASPAQLVITGKFVIEGYEPDGDSVRFVADDPDLYQQLQRAYRIRVSSRDGSVQLRFEGIDAPELHYGSAAQPLGKDARTHLLELMGFGEVHYSGAANDAGEPTRVDGAERDDVRGAILSKAADPDGRPVSYVLLEADVPAEQAGAWIMVDKALVGRTLNWRMLNDGLAYYMVYTSTPFAHREQLRAVALAARQGKLGVWADDASAEFRLDDQQSIGVQNGKLIFPKLFRRCTDYLKAVDRGFNGNLTDWMIWVSTGSRHENDGVVLRGPSGLNTTQVRFSDLLDQRNRDIALKADLLDMTFVET